MLEHFERHTLWKKLFRQLIYFQVPGKCKVWDQYGSIHLTLKIAGMFFLQTWAVNAVLISQFESEIVKTYDDI